MNMTTHAICDACECVSHCSKNGCIPLTPIFRAPSVGYSGETTGSALQNALDFLCGLHPEITIDGPPMQVAERIFDAVLADRAALSAEIKNMEVNLAFMRTALTKAAGSRA
jgi:hypothetical protein